MLAVSCHRSFIQSRPESLWCYAERRRLSIHPARRLITSRSEAGECGSKDQGLFWQLAAQPTVQTLHDAAFPGAM